MNAIIQLITATIGSFGFAILFNIRGKRALAAGFGGLLSWGIFLLMSLFIHNDPINYFIASVLTSIYAEIMARILKTPTTTFITTSLIPLVPGGSLYYTMAYAFESDSKSFLSRGTETLQLASALALGVIVAATATKLYVGYRVSKKKQALERAKQ